MSEQRILCLDPASGKFYSSLLEYSSDPELIIYPEETLPSPYKHNLLAARVDTLRAVRQLSSLDSRRWALDEQDSQLLAFRRRRLPPEMRVRVDCIYPKYVADSSLSEAFQHTTLLSLDINLEPFKDQIISPEMRHILQVVNQSISLEISVEVELVTSADSAIQTIVRKVEEKFKKGIKCEPERQFCLKVQGLEDYMYGSTLMMDFQHTRQIIRGYSSMQLTLLQVDLATHCPCPYLFQGSPDWEALQEAPLFLWYAPFDLDSPLQTQEPAAPPQRLSIKESQQLNSLPLLNVMSEQWVPEKGRPGGRALKSVTAGPAMVFSGEQEKPLQVELVSVDNLDQIMGLNSRQAAQLVDHGQQPPPYVTFNRKDAHLRQLMKSASQKKAWWRCIWGGASLSKCSVSVETSLYLGNRLLWQTVNKQRGYQAKQVLFRETLPLQGQLWQLPLETRLCFEVSVGQNSLDRRVVAVCQAPLFDLQGRLLQGPLQLLLWPFSSLEPRIACMGQFRMVTNRPAPCLTICISHPLPVYWSLSTACFQNEVPAEVTVPRASLNRLFNLFQILLDKPVPAQLSPEEYQESLQRPPSMDDVAQLERILKTDHLSLEELSPQDKAVLFRCRHKYSSVSGYLIYLLKAVDFTRPDQVLQVYHLLEQWSPLEPWDALVLLDSWMADQRVRAYAVGRVALFPDEQLVLYMLQLVQALQFENMLHSPLATLLLSRALASPFVVGHEFFWLLRSYLTIKPSFERYALLLEQFLMCCGPFRHTLYQQFMANNIIASISQQLSKNESTHQTPTKQKGKEKKLEAKTRLLQKLLKNKKGFPDEFALAIDPRIMVKGVEHKECKLFSSKKMPLNLKLSTKTFLGQAGEMRTIFKTGDDLRMDMVAIQLIRIMDRLWLDNGLDLRMKPYKVVSTWDHTGIIEMVPNSTTISDIHSQFGGATGALDKETIIKYLESHNPTPEGLKAAQQNFLRSCAGYCVATFIMGVGDRHNGNIMVAQTGHFFHIDFGHFLGNFKSKFGFKRERTFFVFSREMQHAITYRSPSNFERFQELCCEAYQIIRTHGNVLIQMFLMMLSSGMPELRQKSDIDYLRDRMEFALTQQEAMAMFRQEIQRSLQDIFRVFDNQIHNMKHSAPQKTHHTHLDSIDVQI